MTKEEFVSLIDEYVNEFEEIKRKKEELYRKRSEEIFKVGKLSSSTKYDEECDYYENQFYEFRSSKKYEIVEAYNQLSSNESSLRENILAYFALLKFAKENGLDNIGFINDRAKFLEDHYHKEEQFDVEYNYYPTDFYEMPSSNKNEARLSGDLNNVLNYFNNKKEKDIYTWEIDYISFLLFHDQLCHTSYVKEIFGDYKNIDRNQECDEYVRNCNQILIDMENNIFDFSLLVWTIYKIYHYFRNKNLSFIVKKGDFILIDKLISLGFITVLVDWDKSIVKENKELDENERVFIFNASQLLCLDLIHTINRGFPNYYSNCIMFLGYNLYEPAGCSSLNVKMENFDMYIEGIKDYDYWLDASGDEVFEKLDLSYDYDEVVKNTIC